MPILIKTFWVSIILFYGTCVFAEDIALNLAERFFDSGNYEEAITEYKRFIFFNSQSDSVDYAYYKIGSAYRNQERWKESMDVLRQSIQTASNDSIRNEREIALAIVLIASGNYSIAEFQLLRIESFSPFLTLKRKAAFFRGIASLYEFKWKEAREAFRVYFASDSIAKSPRAAIIVDSLLSAAQDLNYKSPKLAKLLSTFLPGVGQMYAGDWHNGLNALAINSVTSYLLISNVIEGNYSGVFTIYLSLFLRYYYGNRYHAEKIAQDYNNRLNKKLAQNILEFLSK